MFKDFIGRNVEVLIGFAGIAEARPDHYCGIVKDADDKSVKLSLFKRGFGGKMTSTNYNGELIEFNVKYIIWIRELL